MLLAYLIFLCLSPRINHFPKELWLFIREWAQEPHVPSIYVFTHLAYPSVYLSCLSIHHICLSVHCVYQSIYIVCPSAYPSIYLSIRLSYLSTVVRLSDLLFTLFLWRALSTTPPLQPWAEGAWDGPVGFSTY